MQKIPGNVEEFTGLGGSVVTVGLLRTCWVSISKVIEFGDLIEGPGGLEGTRDQRSSEVMEDSEHGFEGLGVSLVCRLSDPELDT